MDRRAPAVVAADGSLQRLDIQAFYKRPFQTPGPFTIGPWTLNAEHLAQVDLRCALRFEGRDCELPIDPHDDGVRIAQFDVEAFEREENKDRWYTLYKLMMPEKVEVKALDGQAYRMSYADWLRIRWTEAAVFGNGEQALTQQRSSVKLLRAIVEHARRHQLNRPQQISLVGGDLVSERVPPSDAVCDVEGSPLQSATVEIEALDGLSYRLHRADYNRLLREDPGVMHETKQARPSADLIKLIAAFEDSDGTRNLRILQPSRIADRYISWCNGTVISMDDPLWLTTLDMHMTRAIEALDGKTYRITDDNTYHYLKTEGVLDNCTQIEPSTMLLQRILEFEYRNGSRNSRPSEPDLIGSRFLRLDDGAELDLMDPEQLQQAPQIEVFSSDHYATTIVRGLDGRRYELAQGVFQAFQREHPDVFGSVWASQDQVEPSPALLQLILDHRPLSEDYGSVNVVLQPERIAGSNTESVPPRAVIGIQALDQNLYHLLLHDYNELQMTSDVFGEGLAHATQLDPSPRLLELILAFEHHTSRNEPPARPELISGQPPST